MKKILLPCLLSFIGIYSFGQTFVQYEIEPKIQTIEQAHKEAWQKVDYVNGYRIQLVSLSGSQSRSTAEAILREFESTFPDIPAYIVYQEPNFKVRVGNYEFRSAAYRQLQTIRTVFPGAFISKDKISYRTL